MGSAESKVAAQPLAVVAPAVSSPPSRRSAAGWTCNLLKKQNRTAPVLSTATPTAPATSHPPATPRSTPTMEAVKASKASTTITTTSITSSGPSAQILAATKAISLQQLSVDELSTQLLKAVKNGDQRLVERVVDVAASKQWQLVDIRGMWESTPLIYACQYCHEPIALWLLAHGARVHLANEKGVTALLLASLEGMAAATQQILERSGASDTTTATETALAIDEQVGVVYNSVADVNVRASPLLAASMNGHEAVVRLLLTHGADVNHGVAPLSLSGAKSSGDGGSSSGSGSGGSVLQFPLLVAAKYGHTAVAELLIEHGADISEVDGNENHALLLACEAAKEDCALALLRLLQRQSTSDDDHAVWKRTNVHGFTALHFCAVHGLVHAAHFMLRELRWATDAAFLNATSSTRHECAVLMAVRKKQYDVVKLLFDCGADATLADRGATTALDVLRRDKRDELVELWQELQTNRHDERAGGNDRPAKPVHGNETSQRDEMPDTSVAMTELSSADNRLISDDEVQSSGFGSTTAEAALACGDTDISEQLEPDRVDADDDTLHPTAEPRRGDRASCAAPASPPRDSEAVMETERPRPVVELAALVSVTEQGPTDTYPLREPEKMTEDTNVGVLNAPVMTTKSSSVITDQVQLPEDTGYLDETPDVVVSLDMVPHKPLGHRSKSTTGRKGHTRRATGFNVEPQTKANSLSNLGALTMPPLDAEGDEDAEEADPLASIEDMVIRTTDTADGSAGAMASQASPGKASERHKKKKRHSKKKTAAETVPSPKTKAVPPLSLQPKEHDETEMSPPSLCIPTSRSDTGELDDDF